MDLGTLNRAGTAGRLVSLVLSLASLLLVWWLAAQLAATPLLPGPAMVFAAIAREAASGDLVHHTAITLIRVLASFLIAMAIGSAIGLALGRREALNRLFDSWLLVALNMPALVVIVLAYVWFGLTEAAAVGAVAVNKIPTVAVTLREGARALDRDLDEMARSFRLGRGRRLWRIVLPQIRPGLAAAWGIAFVLGFGELGVSILVAPPGEATLPIRIYTIIANTPPSHVAALALLQTAVILTPVAALGVLASLRPVGVARSIRGPHEGRQPR